MIKKVFVGVLLAAVFGLLILGAVNRTIAKTTDDGPLALSQNLGENNEPKNENRRLTEEDQLYGRNRTEDTIGEDSNSEGGWRGGGGNAQTPGENTGMGLAEVDAWLTFTGTVESVSQDLWTITLTDGSTLEIEGRKLSFMLEQGFVVEVGDNLTLTGFYEGESIEIGQIIKTNSGEMITIRDQNGRPLWSGGRQGGGSN
jgi:hypothetical protein